MFNSTAYYQRPSSQYRPRFDASAPREIAAKFAGTCRSCRGPIAVGERITWSKAAGSAHVVCPVVVEVEVVDVQSVLAGAVARLTDAEIERAWGAEGIDNITLAVLEAELDARLEGAVAVTAPAPVAPVAEPARLEVEHQGVYVLPDGAVVRVKANREKTRVYASRWTVTGQDRLTEAGTHEHGEYVYEAGLIRQVEREGRKMTGEEARAHSLRYGQCVRCGRGLVDGKSVEAGMGPVCRKYFGL
jgi:hypothetical protein